MELANEIDDQALVADVLMVRVGAETLLGRDTAAAAAERAMALQDAAAGLRILDQPLLSLAERRIWRDAHGDARTDLVELGRRADELGDESARPMLLFLLGEVELAAGNLEECFAHARASREAAEQTGLLLFGPRSLALESLVLAQMGRPEPTKLAAEQIRDEGADSLLMLIRSAALGHLALSLGRPHDAVEHMRAPAAFVRRERIVEPGATRFVVDLVEALVELGRRDEACELLDWYEENARRLERASALASCARCRGLLASQSGDLEPAVHALEEALEWHSQVDLPLDRARTLLALGIAQRRLKRRREARTTLEEALGLFERIGAALWAERTRGELKRISGRAATPGALTPAEERVAVLVAEGKTNKEVAAALYLSDRTVEGHLARIFGKLGIRHRTEVGPALQTRGISSSNTGDAPVSVEPSAP